MSVVSTALVTPGLKSEFFDRLEQVVTYYQDLATRIESKAKSETYAFLGSVPAMRPFGTGRKAQGIFEESYSVENGKYEITLEVDRDEVSDDQTGQIRIRVREMSTRATTHKDALISALLANGAVAGYLAYDGLTFFNAAHVSGDSGEQSNILTPAAVAADTPTTAEFQAALKAGIGRLLGFVDDQAEPMSNSAAGLVAVVPPTMFLTALEAVSTTIVQSVTNVLEGACRVIAFPRLTDLSKFFLLKVDESVRPLIFQDREPIEFTALEQDSDEGFRREKFLYGVRARYAVTYGYWQYACSLDFTEA